MPAAPGELFRTWMTAFSHRFRFLVSSAPIYSGATGEEGMRRIGRWLGIALCSLFSLAFVAAAGIYFLSAHRTAGSVGRIALERDSAALMRGR